MVKTSILSIYMDFDDIETASEEKDLGVTFQQTSLVATLLKKFTNLTVPTLSLIVRTFDYLEKDSK